MPAVTYGEGHLVEWKLPVCNTILHILTNPIYAGTYAFGRTGSRISIEAGRKAADSAWLGFPLTGGIVDHDICSALR
ncbi:hypothetical protein GGE24_007255 [Bradyrhizobium centrosematis]|nr:hypothetical protein [Bradyrhizobium centrosematis]MCS3777880.1 hypothetical protein [Bradyrhizobium centrosematis]